MSGYVYTGRELELFARATHWKAYWHDQLQPHVRGTVLEVGAGSGNNVFLLDTLDYEEWVSLEPDATLAESLSRKLIERPRATCVVGTTSDLPADRLFDTILYLDVLEHIHDDAAELRRAAVHLTPAGKVVVLAPAHQWLYTPFDSAIGHFRRYSRRSLRAAAPTVLSLVSMRYLDAAGLLASIGNRVLLQQRMPSEAQLLIWDKYLVPLSRIIDGPLGYRVGKSVIGVWQNAH